MILDLCLQNCLYKVKESESTLTLSLTAIRRMLLGHAEKVRIQQKIIHILRKLDLENMALFQRSSYTTQTGFAIFSLALLGLLSIFCSAKCIWLKRRVVIFSIVKLECTSISRTKNRIWLARYAIVSLATIDQTRLSSSAVLTQLESDSTFPLTPRSERYTFLVARDKHE